ncbi:retrovirus-related pol polyprotein from transposon TNT 1-94 [Tanacetum coccineum]
MQMVGGNGGNQFRYVQNVGNQNGLIVVLRIANQNVNQNRNGNVVAAQAEGNGNGNNINLVRCYNYRLRGHLARNYTVRPRKRDVAYLQTQLLIAQKEEARIQLQAEEFNLMVAARHLYEIEEVNANRILMANLQNLKLFINFVWNVLGTVRFGNDYVAAILDLEVAFRRNTCFVRNLKGVDLLKGNHTTNLYTINLHEMASASPICLIAHATSTKSWLWHQRLSRLNFETINDLAKNDLVTGLPKFKYHKEQFCPSCEQGKSKKASHPPKLVPKAETTPALYGSTWSNES